MKKTKIIISFILISILILLTVFIFRKSFIEKTTIANNGASIVMYESEKEAYTEIGKERNYFTALYFPEGDPLPDEKYRLSRQIQSYSSEVNSVNSWVLMGPVAIRDYNIPSRYYTGRALDIEIEGVPSLRVSAASGGLWRYAGIFPVSMSDALTSTLRIGSFDSKPGDPNTILVGTGENYWYGVSGAGLYMTTNAGVNYSWINMNPSPNAFYKLRFSQGSSTVAYAATDLGFYKTINAGYNWTRYFFNDLKVTDFAVDPSNPNVIYAAMWDYFGGIYKSTNAGINWVKLSSGGIPVLNIGRTSIGISPSSPQTVFVNFSKYNDNKTLGVYKTINGGTNWTDVSPSNDFHGAQGYHNSVCGVHPTNPNIVWTGGVLLYRSLNGGSTWQNIDAFHGDYQEIAWTANGGSMYVCSDGGVALSNDNGTTWTTSLINSLPITQFYGFDISPNGNYCFGGNQDNGIVGTTNRGVNWFLYRMCDGGFTAIDPSVNSRIAVTANGDTSSYNPKISSNSGVVFTPSYSGITFIDIGMPQIRNNGSDNAVLYYNNGKKVYRSINYGASWSATNADFNCNYIYGITVSPNYPSIGNYVYAALNDNTPTSEKIKRFHNNTWTDVSSGLPLSRNVVKVTAHQTVSTLIYSIMSGSASGQKVYRSTNNGAAWTNVTGDLPNIVAVDLITHPSNQNILYLGTLNGCYKTSNGGVNWQRWNNGLHEATQVCEMNFVDSISANGRYYIVAATHGRSIWYREVSGDDPVGNSNLTGEIPKYFMLYANYPNPFNPVTNIKYQIPKSSYVRLIIYDVLGREVKILVNKNMKAGFYEELFNGSALSSGIYFYSLTAGDFTDTKKMIINK